MSSSNFKELKEIGSDVCELSNFLKKSDLHETFQKADFTKLDRKLFAEIVYFLLDVSAPDLVKSQLEPVVKQSKPHSVFVKNAFQIVGQIKERHPWSATLLLTVQKSHFQDPRPEQNKVVEFLKRLLDVTFYIVSGAEPKQTSVEKLNQEIESYAKAKEELLERKRLSDLDLQNHKECLIKAEAEFKATDIMLREKGIIHQDEPCDRATLLKYIANAEDKLLDKINACLEQNL